MPSAETNTVNHNQQEDRSFIHQFRIGVDPELSRQKPAQSGQLVDEQIIIAALSNLPAIPESAPQLKWYKEHGNSNPFKPNELSAKDIPSLPEVAPQLQWYSKFGTPFPAELGWLDPKDIAKLVEDVVTIQPVPAPEKQERVTVPVLVEEHKPKMSSEEIQTEAQIFQREITEELNRIEEEMDLQFSKLFPRFSRHALAPENLMKEILIDVELLKAKVAEYEARGVSHEVIAPAVYRLRIADRTLMNLGYQNRSERKQVLRERKALKADFDKKKLALDNFKYMQKIAKVPVAQVQQPKNEILVINQPVPTPSLLQAIIGMKPRKVATPRAQVVQKKLINPYDEERKVRRPKRRESDALLTMRVLKAIFGPQEEETVLSS